MIKKCKTCGTLFERTGRAIYCSELCKPRYVRKDKNCLFCGVSIPAAFRYCSVECKKNHNDKQKSIKEKQKIKKKTSLADFLKEIPDGMSYGKYVAIKEAEKNGKKVYL